MQRANDATSTEMVIDIDEELGAVLDSVCELIECRNRDEALQYLIQRRLHTTLRDAVVGTPTPPTLRVINGGQQ